MTDGSDVQADILHISFISAKEITMFVHIGDTVIVKSYGTENILFAGRIARIANGHASVKSSEGMEFIAVEDLSPCHDNTRSTGQVFENHIF